MRVVEDYHVDRPGVEVRQRMKLTGTNNSIDLFDLIINFHLLIIIIIEKYSTYSNVIYWLGDFSEKPTHDPIPNSTVKLLSADGTAS